MIQYTISRIVGGFALMAVLSAFHGAHAQYDRSGPPDYDPPPGPRSPAARGPQNNASDPDGYPGPYPEDAEGRPPSADRPPYAARERLIEELNRLRQHKSETAPKAAFNPPLPTKKKGAGNSNSASVAAPAEDPSSVDKKSATAVNPELDRLVSPLLLFHFSGTQPNDPGVRGVRNLIQTGGIVGVVVSSQNVSSKAQLKELLKFFAQAAPTKLRPLIAANQTGGKPDALPADVGLNSPRQRDVAAKRDPQYAYLTYQTMGANLASVGFNMNFGPWLSLSSTPTETVDSYGTDPLQAAVFAKTFLMGHKESGVLAAPLINPVEGDSMALKALLVSFPNTPVAIKTSDDAKVNALQVNGAVRGARFCFVTTKPGLEGLAVVEYLKKGCDGLVLPLTGEKPDALRQRIGLAVSDAVTQKALDANVLVAASQRMDTLRAASSKETE